MRPLGLKPALIWRLYAALKRHSATVFYGTTQASQLSETSIFVAGATLAPAFVLEVIDATIRYVSNTSSTNA